MPQCITRLRLGLDCVDMSCTRQTTPGTSRQSLFELFAPVIMRSQICPCRCVQPPMRAVQTDCRKFINVLKSSLHMFEDENS